jgi:hypothetical protein
MARSLLTGKINRNMKRSDRDSPRIRIARLKNMIKECPSTPDLPQTIQHILKTALQGIRDLEITLQNATSPHVLEQINAVLSQMESYIEWAAGEAGGRRAAENIRAGRAPDPDKPPDRRFMERITSFVMGKIDKEVYLSLIRQWGGDDAVQGDIVSLDPRELDALSQWMMFDIVFPGQSRRLIEIYTQEAIDQLPDDERALLTAELNDRPSIYQIAKIPVDMKTHKRKSTYIVKDLLTNEPLRIRDRATSLSLHQGAIFIGRAIASNHKEATYTLLGSITEISSRVWSEISVFIDELHKNHCKKMKGASAQEFFRSHYALLRRRLQETIR